MAAVQGEAEEQDDFFLQDNDSDSDPLPGLAAPVVTEVSTSTAEGLQGADTGALLQPQPVAAELGGPVAKRPRLNPPAAYSISAAPRRKLQPAVPGLASPSGAPRKDQQTAASKQAHLRRSGQAPFNSSTSGSYADGEMGGLSSNQTKKQMLSQLPAGGSTLAGDRSNAADMDRQQLPMQRPRTQKRQLDDVFDDSSASEPEADLVDSRHGDQQHGHPQLAPQSLSQSHHLRDPTFRSVPDTSGRGGIRHGKAVPNKAANKAANNLSKVPHSAQQQDQKGRHATDGGSGVANAALELDRLSNPAAAAQKHQAESNGQQPAEGSHARLQRLQALAAAIQRKQQPTTLEPQPGAPPRLPKAPRHLTGMARGSLEMAAGRAPARQSDHAQVHGKQHQHFQPGYGVKPGGGMKRHDQHRGRSAGKVGEQAAGKTSVGRKPLLTAVMPAKSLATAPEMSVERGQQAGNSIKSNNGPGPAFDGRPGRHDTGPERPKPSTVADAAGRAGGVAAEDAAKGRTRAEGGRKRRKRK